MPQGSNRADNELGKEHHLQSVIQEHWMSIYQKMKLDPHLSPCEKNQHKMVKQYKRISGSYETTRRKHKGNA